MMCRENEVAWVAHTPRSRDDGILRGSRNGIKSDSAIEIESYIENPMLSIVDK